MSFSLQKEYTYISHIAYCILITRTLFLPFSPVTTLLLLKYIVRIVLFPLGLLKRR